MTSIKEAGLSLVELGTELSKARDTLHKKVYIHNYHVCIHIAYGDLDLSIWHKDKEVSSSVQVRVPPVGKIKILCTGGYPPDEVCSIVAILAKQLEADVNVNG